MNDKAISEKTKTKRIFYGIFVPTVALLCLGAWCSEFFLERGLLTPMIMLVVVGQTILQIWMFFDCVKREFKSKNTKKNWIAAILIGIVGIFIYFLKVYNKDLNLNYQDFR